MEAEKKPEQNETVTPIEGEDEAMDQAQGDADPRIAALESELAEVKDRMMRALAEVENTRKRSEKAQVDAGKFAVSGFAKDMLDVADNMRRAIDAVPAADLDKNDTLKMLVEGIEATQSVMTRAFEKHGMEVIAPTEGRFDPNMHEVMFEADMPSEVPGTIIQLLEPGYLLNGRLLRPARVGVAKGGDPSGHAVDTQV